MGYRVKRRSPPRPVEEPEFQAQKEPVLEMVVSEPPGQLIKQTDQDIDLDPMLSNTVLQLRSLAKVGQEIESLGTVRIGNGIVLSTKEGCFDVVRRIRTALDDGGDVLDHGKVMASVANAMARLAKEFREQNDVSPHKGPRRNRSFAPGKTVSVEERRTVTVNES
jgi:hypothetical protein